MWRLLGPGGLALLIASVEAFAVDEATPAATSGSFGWLIEKAFPPILGGLLGYVLGRSGRGKIMLTPASADPPRIDVEKGATFLTLSSLANYLGPRGDYTFGEKLRLLGDVDLKESMANTIRTLEWAERAANESVAFVEIAFELKLILANVGRKAAVTFLEADDSRYVRVADSSFRVVKVAGDREAITIKEGDTIERSIKVKLQVVDPSVGEYATMPDLEAFRHMHAVSRLIASGDDKGLKIDIPIRVIDFGTSVLFRSKLEKRSSSVKVPVVLFARERAIEDRSERLGRLIEEDEGYRQWIHEQASKIKAFTSHQDDTDAQREGLKVARLEAEERQ